jgi:hypothetical protein
VFKALLALVIIATGTSSFAAEGLKLESSPRGVVVIEAVKLPPKIPKAHERMRAGIMDALSTKGWIVVQVVDASECEKPEECLPRLAKQTGTNFVLRLSGNRTQDDGYEISLELFQSATTRIKQSEAFCDYCDIQRMTEVTGRSAVGMLNNALKEEAEAKTRQKQLANFSSEPPPVDPSPIPALPNNIATPTTTPPSSVSWMPWAMIGTGILAFGYGSWMLYEDEKLSGNCTPSRDNVICHRNSSRFLGVTGLVGGGLLSLTGAIWLITTPSRSTAVLATPNHVALRVRF